jgi:peroxiredoxin
LTKRNTIIIALSATLALLGGCSSASSARSDSKTNSNSQQAHSDRKAAPDFTLQDANGASVKLSDYKGKVVLLNFWATWCGPCALEIPWFEEFEQQYKSKGFEVLGVSMDEDGWKAIKPYIAEHKVNYRVVLGNDSVSQLYGGVDSLPTTFVLDRDGKVAYVHVGLAGKNEYLNEIQNLLAGGQTTQTRATLSVLPAVLVSGAAK